MARRLFIDRSSADLVKDSFQKVEAIRDVAAALFYNRIFEMVPEVKPLFKHDIRFQGQMFMEALKLAVDGIHDPSSILPAVKALGTRHVAYGVKPEYFAPVGKALLFTLERCLAEGFTNDVKQAWIEAYDLLSTAMIEAQNASVRS